MTRPSMSIARKLVEPVLHQAHKCLQAFAMATMTIAGAAQAQSCPFDTVWRGSVGGIPVTIKFDSEGVGEGAVRVGSYYYKQSIKSLHLKLRSEGVNDWDEYDEKGKITGMLRMTCSGEEMAGYWQSLDGAKQLVLSAQKTKAKFEDRLATQTLQTVKLMRLASGVIRVVQFPGVKNVQGVQIVNPTPQQVALNRQLRKDLESNVESHLYCLQYGYERNSFDDSYYANVRAPKAVWKGSSLAIYFSIEGNCALAHPYVASYQELYDTNRGDAVKLDTLLDWHQHHTPPVEQTTEPKQEAKKEKKATKMPKTDPEPEDEKEEEAEGEMAKKEEMSEFDKMCAEASGSQDSHPSFVTKEGLVFVTRHSYVNRMCDGEETTPWEDLLPYLTAAGRKVYSDFTGKKLPATKK